jgi:hypothetical protein
MANPASKSSGKRTAGIRFMSRLTMRAHWAHVVAHETRDPEKAWFRMEQLAFAKHLPGHFHEEKEQPRLRAEA